jgi:hypothetical protein
MLPKRNLNFFIVAEDELMISFHLNEKKFCNNFKQNFNFHIHFLHTKVAEVNEAPSRCLKISNKTSSDSFAILHSGTNNLRNWLNQLNEVRINDMLLKVILLLKRVACGTLQTRL